MAKAARHARRRETRSNRPYARMARVNELCHQIVAEELERLDDERLDLVTVTHVSIDPDLRRGVVEITALNGDDAAAVEVLEEHRARLQGAIGRQARLKRTPELHFRADVVVRTGQRIESVLHDVGDAPEVEVPDVYKVWVEVDAGRADPGGTQDDGGDGDTDVASADQPAAEGVE